MLYLQLQPTEGPVAAGWLLDALEGRAKQEILSMGAEDVNTIAKIFDTLEQTEEKIHHREADLDYILTFTVLSHQ